MKPSVHPCPTPAHAHKTALVHKGLLDHREAQVRKDHEEIEETRVLLVQWVHEVSQDSQAQWAHPGHRGQTDYLYLENRDVKGQREIREPLACLVYLVLLGHGALWARLGQAALGAHQERRDSLAPEVHLGPWEHLETLVYLELLENLENLEIQEAQALLALKERKERGETLLLRT